MVLLNELVFFRNLDHNQNEMRDDSISASLLSFFVVCVMLNHYYHVLLFYSCCCLQCLSPLSKSKETYLTVNLLILSFCSSFPESHRFCDRVQDAYTLRCCPQVTTSWHPNFISLSWRSFWSLSHFNFFSTTLELLQANVGYSMLL